MADIPDIVLRVQEPDESVVVLDDLTVNEQADLVKPG
jgi:hypothetical protein